LKFNFSAPSEANVIKELCNDNAKDKEYFTDLNKRRKTQKMLGAGLNFKTGFKRKGLSVSKFKTHDTEKRHENMLQKVDKHENETKKFPKSEN
jgi:hypothetical protein